MITKERVQAAIKYMISSGFAENQKDLAEKIGFNATNLSQAKKGDERYLTEGLAQRLSTNNSGINLSCHCFIIKRLTIGGVTYLRLRVQR